MVKLVDPSKDEARILESLQRDLECPANHVVPCEVVHSDRLLIIMPRLVQAGALFGLRLSSALDAFDQILEVRGEGNALLTGH